MADRTVSVKLTADIADYIAKMQAAGRSTRDLETANRNLRAAQDDAENSAGRARVSEAQLSDVRKNSKSTTAQLAAAEEQHDANLRKLDASIRKVTQAEKEQADAFKRAQDEVSNSSNKAQDEIKKAEKSAKSSFSPAAFAGLSLGLPAAAAVGAAGAGLAIGGIATLFAGLGVFIASQDDAIAQHWTDTMNNIEAQAKTMGSGFKTEVTGAIDDMSAAWTRMAPAVNAAINASAPAVRTFTGAITDLAENAMPGMVTAVLAAQPAMLGLRSLTASTGTGLSQFFTNVSQGSVAAGAGLSNLGGTVQLLLGRMGSLFANLANGSAGPLNSLHTIVDKVTGALVNMTASGSGVLGFFQGATNSVSGMSSVLSAAVSLLSLLPPQVTELGGSFTVVSKLASKLGLDATAGFSGMKAAISDASGGAGKASAAISGLAKGAINPAFLAVGLLSVGLDILGQNQAKAAAAAAAHSQNVQDLTQSLRADNSVIGANTEATIAKALQDKNAAANLAVFGSTLGQATAAATGNKKAMDDVTTSSNGFIQSLVNTGDVTQGQADQLKALNAGLLQNGGSWDTASAAAYGWTGSLATFHPEMMSMLQETFNATGAVGEQAAATREAQKTQQDYNNAISGAGKTLQDSFGQATGASAAVRTLSTDFAKLAGTGSSVAEVGKSIIDVLRTMAGQTPSVDEAMQAWNDTIRTLSTTLKGLNLKGQGKDLIDVSGAINTTSEAGSKLQDSITGAADQFAAYGKSLKDSGASSSDITSKLGTMRGEFAKQLKQLGLNDIQVNTLLNHYGLIPDKIVTTLGLEGNSDAQQQIQELVGQLDSLQNKHVGVPVKILSDAARQALIQLGYQIVQIPDGTFQVFANTASAEDKTKALTDFINKSGGLVTIKATDGEAQATLTTWTKRADGTTGYTTLDSRVDPADGKLDLWTRQANGSWAWTHLDTRIDPATNKVQGWVALANGTWGWANLNANTAAAEAAIDQAARPRTANITITYTATGLPNLPAGANRAAFADGGVAKMASGGVLGMAGGGGLTSMRPVAAKIPPNTWRVVGDRMKDDEYYIPANNSARSRAILSAAMLDPKLGDIGNQIASGYAAMGAMSAPIVVQMNSESSSAGLSPQMVSGILSQMMVAIESGLSKTQVNIDNRGIATMNTQGRALNDLR